MYTVCGCRLPGRGSVAPRGDTAGRGSAAVGQAIGSRGGRGGAAGGGWQAVAKWQVGLFSASRIWLSRIADSSPPTQHRAGLTSAPGLRTPRPVQTFFLVLPQPPVLPPHPTPRQFPIHTHLHPLTHTPIHNERQRIIPRARRRQRRPWRRLQQSWRRWWLRYAPPHQQKKPLKTSADSPQVAAPVFSNPPVPPIPCWVCLSQLPCLPPAGLC